MPNFLVEIFVKRDELITIDFGSFGICIHYLSHINKDEFNVFFGNDYLKFMDYCQDMIPQNYELDSVVISVEVAKEIKVLFKKWEKGAEVSYGELWHLLRLNFPNHMKRYGR